MARSGVLFRVPFGMNTKLECRGGKMVFALAAMRSEEHTSELQSRLHLVCRLLLEKKKESHHCHLDARTDGAQVDQHLQRLFLWVDHACVEPRQQRPNQPACHESVQLLPANHHHIT